MHGQPHSEQELYEQTSEVNNIMVQYRADFGNLSRFYVIENSPERRQRLLDITKACIDKLARLDFDRLNTGTRVEYVLFNRDLQEQVYQLDKEAAE